jgi:preprotein translocase subunit SecD
VPRRFDARVAVAVLALSTAAAVGGCSSGRTHPRYVVIAESPPAVTTPEARNATVQTTAVLRATTVNGVSPNGEQLSQAAKILTRRFVDAGRPAPTITIAADHTLRFSIPVGMTADDIATLIARDAVTFRPVLAATTARPATGPVPPDAMAARDGAAELARAKAAVGSDAYRLATSLTRPATNATTIRRLAPFRRLSAAEVAVLPERVQMNVPTISCAQLAARNPLFLTDDRFLNQPIAACDSDQPNVKYLLGPAKLTDTDLAKAAAHYDPVAYAATGGWTIELMFTATGQREWTALTTANVDHQIAILTDGDVMSAPYIQSAVNGPAVVSGRYVTEPVAQRIAKMVNAGPLPLEFAVTAVSVGG